jgi:hypothetical protein
VKADSRDHCNKCRWLAKLQQIIEPGYVTLAKLIVTNGDSAVERIQAAGIKADVLAWKDVLHDGPVPMTPNLAALTAIRAQFLSSLTAERKPVAELYQRDRVLAGAGIFKEVILWFEHDLYDQLQLIQVLDLLGQRTFKDTLVSIINSDKYVGTLEPNQAQEVFATRTPVVEEQYELASRAWTAFRASTPKLLLQFIEGTDNEQAALLPFLLPALRRLLEELPQENGLSRSQQQILLALKSKNIQPARTLYKAAHHEREEPIWLGDWSFALRLLEMSETAQPTITLHYKAGASEDAIERTLDSTVELTPFGEEVLGGTVDYLDRNGINRWLGGTHLQKGNVWRWISGEQVLRAG